jgi:GntR family transcriptional regulator/MocR family aminotransferase
MRSERDSDSSAPPETRIAFVSFPLRVVGHNSHLRKLQYDHYDLAMKRVADAFSPVIAVNRNAGKPLHKQIYDAYRGLIVSRNLRAGQQIPSTRALAAELKISRIPVLTAYSQLLAEGYFEARRGAGTFVCSSLPDQVAPTERSCTGSVPVRSKSRTVSQRAQRLPPYEIVPWLRGLGAFSISQPAYDQFPFQVWSALVMRHCRNPHASDFHYGGPLGFEPLRDAICTYLRTARAVRCDPQQVMIVSGSQHALEISARVLLDPGSPVWMEEPGYWLTRHVLTAAGCILVPVPVDAEGLDVTAGIRRCRKARAVYVAPSHQFPLGATMSASRRLQLLDWAERAGSWIIEDDYDSEYRYGSMPIAALQGLDHNFRVIYTGTFSKTLFPSLRIGYMVVPQDLVGRFAAVRNAMDLGPPHLYQAVLTDFISEGHFARHIRRMRLLYGERRAALVDSIQKELGPSLKVLGVEAGMHLAVTLPKGFRDGEIARSAARERLWLAPLSPSYLRAASQQGFILGFGSTPAREIPRAVAQLRKVLLAHGNLAVRN